MRPKLNKKRLVFVLILALLALIVYAVSGRAGNTQAPLTDEQLDTLELLESVIESDAPQLQPIRPDNDPDAEEPVPDIGAPQEAPEEELPEPEPIIDENGSYTSADDVALYLFLYGHLPDNFITKKEAKALGWPGGSLEPYAPGKCIGGDRFGNNEGLLPDKKGRQYYECDVNTLGARSRGAERIIFSNDGLIYYTPDHYESFTLLYGNE